jgi:photosystem II stability/assembly factor-like uncharacterized protein
MRFFFTTILILFFHSIGYSQWISQNSGTSESFQDVEFINQFTGWATGYGTILKTTNGGNNWFQQSHPSSDKSLHSIHPVDENILYCVGWFETILKTTNGGENWIALRNGPFGEGSSYFACYFIDENIGWVAGTGYKVWKTTDGGQTFDSIFISVNFIQDMYFKNPSEGLLSGYGGQVRKTTDSGLNWLGVNINLNGSLCDFEKITVINNQLSWIVGNDGRVFYSADFGSNWELRDTIHNTGQAQIYCVRFSSQNIGWAGGSYGNLWKSTNGGLSWLQEQTNGDQRFFGSMWFYNDSIGWGVGGAGKIFHTTTGGQTLVNISSSNQSIVNSYELYQNYPNPFNPKTNIKFDVIGFNTHIQLKIFNTLGEEIETLVDKKMSLGNYTVEFDAKNLPSGIYYYSFITDDYVETKKMVLVK